MEKPVKKISGVVVPMVTPLHADNSIDKEAVALLIKTFVKAGCTTFVLGTTGESTSVSEHDKAVLVKTAAEQVQGKAQLYAGISGNCMKESIENAMLFASFGANAVVAHLPFYYPLSAANMIRYFMTLADSIPCPLILYNNPVTVKCSIPIEVIDELSRHPNIWGVKDSERDMERLNACLEHWSTRTDFSFLLGWSAKSAYAMDKGCDGIVPGTANLIPQMYQQLYTETLAGNTGKASMLQQYTDAVTDLYTKGRIISESIPALKVLLAEYNLCKPHVLPPLYEEGPAEQTELRMKIRSIMKETLPGLP